MSKITSMLEKNNPTTILDVATGNGNFLKFLIDNTPDFIEAIGIDFKETAENPFGKTFEQNPRVRFKVMSAEKMTFSDSSFDVVSISNSLHHLQDPDKVLREMLRVLKPGGCLIINEMYCDDSQSPAQQTHVLLHHWWAAVDRTQNVIHKETFTRQQLVNFAQNLGLDNIDMEDQVDLSTDPLDPEIITELTPIIQQYIKRAEGYKDLQKQGSALLERLQTIGFQSASSLLLIGFKRM